MSEQTVDAGADQEIPAAFRWSRRGFLVSAGAMIITGIGTVQAGATGLESLAADTGVAEGTVTAAAAKSAALPTRAGIVAEFKGRKPKKFGMFLPGVITHGKHRVALTFDACGGPRGSHYDKSLITTLRKHRVPATLFLNSRWIEAHRSLAADLAADPLFEIGNHGWHHRPLTVRGQSAYGISGTRSAGQAYDEIVRGLDAVAELTGHRPRWYRPGTAWVDDVGVAFAKRLGVRVVNFSINADYGATASTSVVAKNFARARSKSITLAHFNQPGGRTAEGLARELPQMLHAGRHFGTLSKALA